MAKDPFEGVFGDLFGDFFGSKKLSKHVVPGLTNNGGLRSYSSESDAKGMTLFVDLPGVDPTTVTLEVGGDLIVVRAKHLGKDLFHKYTISSEFDVKSAIASLIHGRLEIRLRRCSPEQPKFQKVHIDFK